MSSMPEDIYFKGKPNTDDIRGLLREMNGIDMVSHETAQLFGVLAVTPPERRLAGALANTISILVKRNVRHILADGLLDEEYYALLELDQLSFSIESRVTARGLLCVKERYAMVKGIRGYFNSARQEEDSQLRV